MTTPVDNPRSNLPTHPFEFFEGGVAPIESFDVNCGALLQVQEASAFGENSSFLIIATPPIVYVALLAFAEGFFKSTFSAVGNMCPSALKFFANRRRDFVIPLDDLLLIGDRLTHRAGSLAAERLDFGSARAINGIFFDLVGATPFGKSDSRKYDELLSLRNQLVHHGGIITAKYFRQQPTSETPDDIYWSSVEVTQRTVIDGIWFLREIAKKVTQSCYSRMKELEGDKLLVSEEDKYPIFDYFRGSFSIHTPKHP